MPVSVARRLAGRVPVDEAMKKPPPSAWLAMTLTALGLLATVAFSLGTVVLLADPPDPGAARFANARRITMRPAGVSAHP
jgi:hypothetical protein